MTRVKETLKKTLAVFFAVVMTVSLVPAAAFAADGDDPDPTEAAYMSVYVKDGAAGEPQLAAQLSKSELYALEDAEADPASYNAWRNGSAQVRTATRYVALEDLVAASGEAAQAAWAEPATKVLATDAGGFEPNYIPTVADLTENMAAFYPGVTASSQPAEPAAEAPAALALAYATGYVGTDGDTAGDVAAAIAERATPADPPTFMYGISAEQLAGQSAYPNRFGRDICKIVLTLPGSIELGEVADAEFTGWPVEPELSVTDTDTGQALAASDFTVSYASASGLALPGAPVDPGAYTVIVSGAAGTPYEGMEDSAAFEIDDVPQYFSVYVKDGAAGDEVLSGSFSKAELFALETADADPASYIAWQRGNTRVFTATRYVELASAVGAAGEAAQAAWAEPATKVLVTDSTGWAPNYIPTVSDLTQTMNLFYGGLRADGTWTGDPTEVPAVLALAYANGNVGTDGDTAAEVEAAIAPQATPSVPQPRFLYGISAEQATSQEAYPNRFGSGIVKAVLTLPGSIELGEVADAEFTGWPVEPELSVTDTDTGQALAASDYTVSYASASGLALPGAPVDPGAYTVIVSGAAGTPYEGMEDSAAFEIDDVPQYVSVYTKAGENADEVLAKSFSKSEVFALSDAEADPVGYIAWKGGVAQVRAATRYAAIEAIAGASGEAAQAAWADPATKVIFSDAGGWAPNYTPTVSDLTQTMNKFYPGVTATAFPEEGAVEVPASLVLEWGTGFVGTDGDTAADALVAAVSGASTNNTPMSAYGISAEQLATQEAAPNKFGKGISKIVLVTAGELQVATIPAQTYTGSAIKPKLDVTYSVDGAKLVAGTDYMASFAANTKVGTATVSIVGKGAYAGLSTEASFKISSASIAKATVTAKAQTYTGSALKPAPTVKLGGKTLKAGTDYTVSYKNNVNVGTATVTVTGKGNYTGTAKGTFAINRAGDLKLTRAAGANRLGTMAEIAKTAFPKTSDWAIVAQAVDFPDALGAAALAGAYNAPVITTVTGELSAEAKAQLTRLKVKNVIVLGGEGSVSANTVNQIKKISTVKSVKRVAGDNRFGTSLAAYRQFQSKAKGYDTVVVASGVAFADALTAGPYCYAQNAAMVLGWNKGLEDYLVKAIKADKNVKKVVIVSTGGAVDVAKVKSQLGSGYKYTAITGKDAYATNKAFNTWALSNGMTAEKPVIATGEAFADALAGAPLAGVNNSVMVLVKDSKSASLGAITTAKVKQTVQHAYMLGAKATIDVANAKAIAKQLGLTYVAHKLDSAKSA